MLRFIWNMKLKTEPWTFSICLFYWRTVVPNNGKECVPQAGNCLYVVCTWSHTMNPNWCPKHSQWYQFQKFTQIGEHYPDREVSSIPICSVWYYKLDQENTLQSKTHLKKKPSLLLKGAALTSIRLVPGEWHTWRIIPQSLEAVDVLPQCAFRTHSGWVMRTTKKAFLHASMSWLVFFFKAFIWCFSNV